MVTGTERMTPGERGDYPIFHSVSLRWNDNDIYGHVNNTVYYEWFDSAVNAWLIETGCLDIKASPEIGLVVETRCTYFAPISYPGNVEIGLSLKKLGRSSVTYELGVFAGGAQQTAARGIFTHVYVNHETRRPVAVPETLAQELTALHKP